MADRQVLSFISQASSDVVVPAMWQEAAHVRVLVPSAAGCIIEGWYSYWLARTSTCLPRWRYQEEPGTTARVPGAECQIEKSMHFFFHPMEKVGRKVNAYREPIRSFGGQCIH